jgi:hypothetical protein
MEEAAKNFWMSMAKNTLEREGENRELPGV